MTQDQGTIRAYDLKASRDISEQGPALIVHAEYPGDIARAAVLHVPPGDKIPAYRYLIAVLNPEASVFFWDITRMAGTGQPDRTPEGEPFTLWPAGSRTELPGDVMFTSDGKRLLSCYPNAIRVATVSVDEVVQKARKALGVAFDSRPPARWQGKSHALLRKADTLLGASPGPQSGGKVAKEYPLDHRAGETYIVEMRSARPWPWPQPAAIDCYLLLLDSDGQCVAEDDDGGGGPERPPSIPLPQVRAV